jgi:hypothetical protein
MRATVSGMLGAEHARGAVIGNSPSDVLAGDLAGVPVIGYADKAAKVSPPRSRPRRDNQPRRDHEGGDEDRRY